MMTEARQIRANDQSWFIDQGVPLARGFKKYLPSVTNNSLSTHTADVDI